MKYSDFFKSYRSLTMIILWFVGITPLIYVNNLLAVKLIEMGMAES